MACCSMHGFHWFDEKYISEIEKLTHSKIDWLDAKTLAERGLA